MATEMVKELVHLTCEEQGLFSLEKRTLQRVHTKRYKCTTGRDEEYCVN